MLCEKNKNVINIVVIGVFLLIISMLAIYFQRRCFDVTRKKVTHNIHIFFSLSARMKEFISPKIFVTNYYATTKYHFPQLLNIIFFCKNIHTPSIALISFQPTPYKGKKCYQL